LGINFSVLELITTPAKYEIDKDKIYVTFEFETNKPIIKFDKYKKKISLSSSVYARIDNLWYFIQLNKQKLQFNLVEFLKKSHKIDKKLTLEYEIIANCLTRIMTAYNEYIDKRIDIGYRTEEDSKYYYVYINENDKTIEIQLDYKGAEIQNITEEEIKLNYHLFSKHMEKINFDNIILAKIDLIEHESMIKDFIKQIIDKINENSGIWIYYDINFDNKICTLNIGITTETMNLSMPILIVPVLDNIIL